MFAASSSDARQTESTDTIQGIERSPNAVAPVSTAAVAPPKFQIEESVSGDGGVLFRSRTRSRTSSVKAAR